MGISIGLTANIFYNLFSSYLRAVGNSQVPLFFPDLFSVSECGAGSAFYHPRRYGRSGGCLGDESVPGDLGGALRGIYLG